MSAQRRRGQRRRVVVQDPQGYLEPDSLSIIRRLNKRTKPVRFAQNHQTYEEWAAGAPNTPYTRRIARAHARFPHATLSQLRGHPTASQRGVHDLEPRQITLISWESLSPREQQLRERSRQAYFKAKNMGVSLERAAAEVGIRPSTVVRNIGGFKKVEGRWKPKAMFKNDRPMIIYTASEAVLIPVADSRHSTTIGRYHNAVKAFLSSGEPNHLAPFVGKAVRSADGEMHILETDPRTLYEIAERRPEEEFFSIYGGA